MVAPRKTTPEVDLNPKLFTYEDQSFEVKRKYKMGKFFSALNENPVEALRIVLTDDSYARFEELEMDMDDFKTFMEEVSACMSGSNLKN